MYIYRISNNDDNKYAFVILLWMSFVTRSVDGKNSLFYKIKIKRFFPFGWNSKYWDLVVTEENFRNYVPDRHTKISNNAW